MPVGLISYGAYIPLYRLDRKLIGDTWGQEPIRGERSVANFDEDSMTMGVEAALNCIAGFDRDKIDHLYFATTTSPYKEKQAAATIATALDLGAETFAADFTGSLRAGTIALRLALDAINSGAAKQVMVVAADCRLGSPKTPYEQIFGDGAVAFLIGDTDIAVAIEGSYSIYDEFLDLWRSEGDTYVKFWEQRFIVTEGYIRNMQKAILGLLKKYKLASGDFTKVVYYAPDARSHIELARNLRFDLKTQVQPALFDNVGNTGSAFAPMMLVAALEEANPSDRILLANYGDGADACILRVSDQIKKLGVKRGIKKHLASKMMLPSYGKYLLYRGLLPTDIGPYSGPTSSVSSTWRDYKKSLRFHGSKCRRCNKIQFPMERVCSYCQAKDDYEEVRLSDKKGKVFTFSADATQPSVINPDGPLTECLVQFDEGGRMLTWMTDRDPASIRIGMPVEMTLRKFFDVAGFHNYFWKSRPIV